MGLLDQLVLLTQDIFISSLTNSQRWGIYLDGVPVVVCDNVVSVDYKERWNISKYPVEDGSFATYNKVQEPFEARVRFSAGGSAANRQDLLQSIQSIIGDLNLYDVVTPEVTYPSVTLTMQDYKRASHEGVGLIAVDVGCEQVRVTGSSTTGSNTQSPTAASQVQDGNVQTTALTPAQEVAITGAVT